MTTQADIETQQSTCKECGNVLTKEDIEKVGHNRRGYCIKCNNEYRRDNIQRQKIAREQRVKVLNSVYTGDNLKVMRYMKDESVDLIYLDPPYCTQTNWRNGDYEFSDNWEDENEYLKFMKIRLREMNRILKSTGSIYLHVDYRVVFELKVIMDKIFGKKNFVNDIVWAYSGRETAQSRFPHKHDTILIYSKSEDYTFNTLYKPYRKEYLTFFKYNDNDGNGKYRLQPNGKGGQYKQYLDKMKGHVINDVWSDIKPLNNFGRQQALQYPTQKPIELLERVIKTSSNSGDIVFDPFCGSGTTLEAAKNLGRKYIGIDEKKQAVELSIQRTPKGVSDNWE